MAIPSAFQKVYKLSTCLKASRLWRRRIFGVLLETRHSPRPLSLCLQSAHLWAAARWYVRGLYNRFTNSLREHLRCRGTFSRFAMPRFKASENLPGFSEPFPVIVANIGRFQIISWVCIQSETELRMYSVFFLKLRLIIGIKIDGKHL